jgi:hypothetical protein
MLRFFTLALFATGIAVGFAWKFQTPNVLQYWLMPQESAAEELPFAWPPVVGQPYPDLELVDQTGKLTRLSEFRGKVILVELIGTPCAACQSYCGGKQLGTFRDAKLQQNLDSISIYARRYGNFELKRKDVVLVHVLLFNERMQAATPEDAAAWAKHFRMDRAKNQIVLAGHPAMATKQSFNMIPGFHLIDREFEFDRDASGLSPRHNLYTDLLPRMGTLVNRGK